MFDVNWCMNRDRIARPIPTPRFSQDRRKNCMYNRPILVGLADSSADFIIVHGQPVFLIAFSIYQL